jgi:hypothetical protein
MFEKHVGWDLSTLHYLISPLPHIGIIFDFCWRSLRWRIKTQYTPTPLLSYCLLPIAYCLPTQIILVIKPDSYSFCNNSWVNCMNDLEPAD